jgi:hypothetical protein
MLSPIKPRTLVKARFISKTSPMVNVVPSCKDCKWSTENGKICILFSLTDNLFESRLVRKDRDLCGPDGFYFKPKINF